MAFESQGSRLLRALPSCTASHQTSRAGGGAPCTFLSLLDLSEAEQISSKMCCQSGAGVCASSKSPDSRTLSLSKSPPKAAVGVGQCLQIPHFCSSQQRWFQQRCVNNHVRSQRDPGGETETFPGSLLWVMHSRLPFLSWDRHSLAVCPTGWKSSPCSALLSRSRQSLTLTLWVTQGSYRCLQNAGDDASQTLGTKTQSGTWGAF